MLFGGSFWIRTVNKGGNAVIRPLHESAEGFSYMSKQGESPDYECWKHRGVPGRRTAAAFERSTRWYKKDAKQKKVRITNCETCAFYTYDDEYGYYVCEADLDEDEMSAFLRGSDFSCGFYQQMMSTLL